MSDSASSVQKPAGESATQANAVQGVTGGVPIPVVGVAGATSDVTLHDNGTPANHLAVNAAGQAATAPAVATAAAPTYVEGTIVPLSVDLAGTLRTSSGGGGGGSSDVTIHDNGSPTQHLAINGSGQAAIQNPPNLDAAASTLATQATLALIKAKTDNLDVALSTRTKPADTQTVGGTVAVSNFPAVQPVNDNGGSLTVDGTVAISNFPGTQPVSGPLTDTQLRASAVPVSGPLTDTQLRASAVPVSGTFFQATQPVSGTFFQATQPVSGTVTANVGTTNGLALDATLTGGTQKTKLTDGTLNVTLLNSAPGSDTGQVAVPVRVISQLGAGGGGGAGPSIALNDGVTTTTLATVTAANALKVDGSAVVQPVSDGGGSFSVDDGGGSLTVDGVVVSDGTTTAVVDPSFKALRATLRPMEALGFYCINARSGTYTTTTANSIIFSFRWAQAAKVALILKVRVMVFVSAFTTAGVVERQMIAVRSFTASDTNGSSILPTGNNAKLRTSFPTSVAADIRIGAANVSAGTGTADAQPLRSVAAWMSGVGAAIGDREPVILFDATDGGTDHPLVLAQNEGFRIRFGAAETASTRETMVDVLWAEATTY